MDSGFPDSAWIYLNSLRPEEIRESRLRARLSLDRAMALDKSYVDTSDIAILAPAISFYKWPFHQKKRYLTAYYQGRILENGKKDEEAIKALTRAGNLAGRPGDSLYMVRICSAKARIYLRNYALCQAEEATDEGLRWCAPHSPNWSVLILDKTEHLLARKQYEQVDHVLISLPPSSPRWFEAAVHLCRACPEYRKDYEDIFRHNGSLLKSIHPRVQAEYFLMEGEPSRALEMLREEMPKWQTVMFRRHINLLWLILPHWNRGSLSFPTKRSAMRRKSIGKPGYSIYSSVLSPFPAWYSGEFVIGSEGKHGNANWTICEPNTIASCVGEASWKKRTGR